MVGANAQTITELEQQLVAAKSPAIAAKVASDIGRMYFAKGDLVKAQEYFFSSLKSAEKINDQHLMAVACNNIATAYSESENYVQAEQYARRAIAIQKNANDPKGLADAYNSLANTFYMQQKDDSSMLYYRAALHQRELAKDSAGLMAGYKNLGANLFEIGKQEEGILTITKSLNYIRKEDSAKWLGVYLTLSQAYLYSGKLPEAKKYIDLGKPYADKSTAYHKLEDYYYTVSGYYEKVGNTKEALRNYKLYAQCRDSVVSTNKNAQFAELNIRYETEKKQVLIQQQQFEIAQKNNWLIFIAILLVFALVAVYFIYKNQKIKRERSLKEEVWKSQEAASKALFEGEQNERFRIARDLHDSVGQMLSMVKMNLSALPSAAIPSKVQDLVDDTIQEVRNISHNLIPEELNFGLFPALENLFDKFKVTDAVRMELQISEELRSLHFEAQEQLSIYRILQELTSNILKHAAATVIKLQLDRSDEALLIQLSDNGKGFNKESIAKSTGLGWKNVYARVRWMNGDIQIDSGTGQGTSIYIRLPKYTNHVSY
jgi:signal transduction histidine kinase